MKKVFIAAAVAATFLFSGSVSAHTFHSQGYKNECFDEDFKVWYKDGNTYKYYGKVGNMSSLLALVAANPTVSGFAREIDVCDGHTIRQAFYSNGSF